MKIVYCNVEKVPLAWGPNDMTYGNVKHFYDIEDPEVFHSGSDIKDIIVSEVYDPEYTQEEVQTILDRILG